jgi:hypothetical protein
MRTLVVAAAVLIFPGTAAAATWSPPQHLSGAHTFVDAFSPSITTGGRMLAPWIFQDDLGNASHAGAAAASRAAGAGAFGASHALPATVTGVSAYGRDRALLATVNRTGSRLSVRFGTAKGKFGKSRLLRRGVRITRPSLAVNARGDAALAWFEDRGTRTDRVYVALRRAGHRFGKPRRLATGRIRNVAAAIGSARDVLVVWDARGVLRARYKSHRSSSFRRTDTIHSEDAFFAFLRPVVMPSGRAAVAWSAQFASEGGDRGPQFFQVAVRPAGGPRFRAARVLDRVDNPQGDSRRIDAVVDGSGYAVAWSAAGRVKAVRGSGPAQEFGTGELGDLAAGPGGRLAAAWDLGDETTPNSVFASVAPGGGTPFGPAEPVSPPGQDSFHPRAAFSGTEPTVVYVSRPVSETQSFATATTRSG